MANIRVILQENVKNIGVIADEVSVKAGFARNYLLPKNIAVPATAENRDKIASMRQQLEQQAAEKLAAATGRAKTLQGIAITIPVQAMEEGKLYGSIGADEIVSQLKAKGHDVASHEVILMDGSLKALGEFDVSLRLHAEVIVAMKVTLVVAE